MMNNSTKDERGQAYSLEGITAALLIISTVILAITATAITPLTASTSNQQIEEQNRIIASDVLDSTAQQGELHSFVKEWSGTEYTQPPTENYDFIQSTEDVFGTTIAYNIDITYKDSSGEQITESVLDQGEPSDHAAVATRTVIIQEEANAIEQMEGADSDSGFYNVVEVKIEVWTM